LSESSSSLDRRRLAPAASGYRKDALSMDSPTSENSSKPVCPNCVSYVSRFRAPQLVLLTLAVIIA
jgi:hypothetical protein